MINYKNLALLCNAYAYALTFNTPFPTEKRLREMGVKCPEVLAIARRASASDGTSLLDDVVLLRADPEEFYYKDALNNARYIQRLKNGENPSWGSWSAYSYGDAKIIE